MPCKGSGQGWCATASTPRSGRRRIARSRPTGPVRPVLRMPYASTAAGPVVFRRADAAGSGGTRQSRGGLPTLHHGSASPAAATSERVILPARLERSVAAARSRTVMVCGSTNWAQESSIPRWSALHDLACPSTHDAANMDLERSSRHRILREHPPLRLFVEFTPGQSVAAQRDSAMCVVHTRVEEHPGDRAFAPARTACRDLLPGHHRPIVRATSPPMRHRIHCPSWTEDADRRSGHAHAPNQPHAPARTFRDRHDPDRLGSPSPTIRSRLQLPLDHVGGSPGTSPVPPGASSRRKTAAGPPRNGRSDAAVDPCRPEQPRATARSTPIQPCSRSGRPPHGTRCDSGRCSMRATADLPFECTSRGALGHPIEFWLPA